MITLAMLLAMTGLIVIGLDIAVAMGVAGLGALTWLLMSGQMPVSLNILPQTFMNGVNSFPLLAIPLFLLAGEFMNHGGVTQRLVRFATDLVGRIRGGLAQVAVMLNVLVSGMSGSSVAEAAATGSVLIPSMTAAGYPKRFSTGVIAAAATMGAVIPPSIPMVIVGTTANLSIGQLFVAGALPGLVMALCLMIAVAIMAPRLNLPLVPKPTVRQVGQNAMAAVLPMITPVIVFGGLLSGVATVTEAAVLAVLYAWILGAVVYRELKWSDASRIIGTVGIHTAAIMIIVAATNLMGWIMAIEQIGPRVTAFIQYIAAEPWLVLLIINVLLLVLGTAIEPIPIILLLSPILFPLTASLGIDPIHFSVIMVINLMIGLITPPIGLNLFVLARIANISVGEATRGSWPFLLALIVALMIVTYVPWITLVLPNMIF